MKGKTAPYKVTHKIVISQNRDPRSLTADIEAKASSPSMATWEFDSFNSLSFFESNKQRAILVRKEIPHTKNPVHKAGLALKSF